MAIVGAILVGIFAPPLIVPYLGFISKALAFGLTTTICTCAGILSGGLVGYLCMRAYEWAKKKGNDYDSQNDSPLLSSANSPSVDQSQKIPRSDMPSSQDLDCSSASPRRSNAVILRKHSAIISSNHPSNPEARMRSRSESIIEKQNDDIQGEDWVLSQNQF